MWEKSKKSIYIELSSLCNFDCVFCGNHYRKNKGLMNIDIFKLAIKQICDIGIESIRLSPMTGELFTNRHWKKMFRILEDSSNISQFGFFTNLSTLKQGDVLQLLNYKKLKDISVSLYGHDIKSFKLLTGSNEYNHYNVVNNLILMSRISSLFESKNLKIYLKTTKDVDILKLNYLKNLKVEKFTELDNFMGYSQSLKYPALKTIDYKIDCQVLTTKNIVLWNGDFNLCGCRDINQLSTIGNIKNKSIKEMYESNEYTDMINTKLICEGCSGILI